MAHGLSCSTACGNLPGPGLEPVSPALAGGFLTTAPRGKPFDSSYISESSSLAYLDAKLFINMHRCKHGRSTD